jgi:bla regulator protein BlaR1
VRLPARIERSLPLLLPLVLVAGPTLASGLQILTDANSKFQYAIVDKDADVTISSTDRWDTFKKLHRKFDDDVFWFVIDRREYVVTDPAVIAEAQRITKPMQDLGEKQGALGEQQSALGDKQAALGEKQGKLGDRMGELSSRLTRIATRAASEPYDRKADQEQQAIQREMETLSRQMEALGRQQDVLGRQQAPLGEQQEALGKQQERESKIAKEKLEKLARESVRTKRAQPYTH